jgi:hypothetical protein
MAKNDTETRIRHDALVFGVARVDSDGVALDLTISEADGATNTETVTARMFAGLAEPAVRAVLRALRVDVADDIVTKWRTGRPSEEDLSWFGKLVVHQHKLDVLAEVTALRKKSPRFTLPTQLLAEDDPRTRPLLYRALADDPNDAQLLFDAFCVTWTSKREQPEAMQLVRRAIELAPGHGKAHMCCPHAAHPNADMRFHAELGYRLLPGNPFAANNLVLYLQRHGRGNARAIEIAEEGIRGDPKDPGNYMRLVELYERRGEFAKALENAQVLAQLYGPPMDPRTRYCLEQNPRLRDRLRANRVDMAAGIRSRIAGLEIRANSVGKDWRKQ